MQQRITTTYHHQFQVSRPGLVAIVLEARCKSRHQLSSNFDEDLRVEINRLRFRELPPEKHIQLFNIPATCNGSTLKGLKQTIVFLTVLGEGRHVVSLIPRHGAFVEDVHVQELSGKQIVTFPIEKQAEEGDRRPWFTFVLIDLPLKIFSAEVTIERRLRDSDDLKILIDGIVKKNARGGKFLLWYLVGNFLHWLAKGSMGERKRFTVTFEESLDNGVHYIELYADRTPILHQAIFHLAYHETDAEQRAGNIIKTYQPLILSTAKEFHLDPVMVGAVIFQEQANNFNFIDALADYIGGLLHLNTSIGVGQVRVNTARELEKIYPSLDPGVEESWPGEETFVRVERLKDQLTNIRFSAAKLFFSRTRWMQAGFNIEGRPEVLGTLYNIEEVARPITPHAHPEANDFGKGVQENYDKVEALLGL